MCRKFLLLGAFSLLLVAFRAPLRQGKGGFMDGLIREQLGAVGTAGRWIQRSLQDQLLNRRVHYISGEHSWSGKVTAIKVNPTTTSGPRDIHVTVETMASMGDKSRAGNDRAIITLDQISGVMKVAHPYVGRNIKVSYDDIRPLVLPSSPVGMFLAGDTNMIVAVYNDGYLEVDVTGMALGTEPDKTIASGTVFIHAEDIIRDPDLKIVSSNDLETQPSDD